MASTENVSALEASDSSPAAAAPDLETTTTENPPATTDTTASPPSSSLPTAAAEAEATQPAQSESANTESDSKEQKDAEEIEDKSSSPADAAATAPEDTTAAAVATPTEATEAPLSAIKSSEEVTGEVAVPEGEASDQPQAVNEAEDAGPELVITLLLTTGARHPFKIDRKYLRRRSVKVDNDDPFNMSVYTLKELIWREWRSEWEPQPSSPSSIRLISFGKLLDDKSPLSESSLTHDAPNVIHMTVKPQEVVDEEDAKGGKSYSARDRDTTDRSPGCRCIIL